MKFNWRDGLKIAIMTGGSLFLFLLAVAFTIGEYSAIFYGGLRFSFSIFVITFMITGVWRGNFT